jgi:hypothetical protein
MAGVVAHHFRCEGCGYDLYQTPLDGNCPECGRRVPKRKSLAKPKNPKRVNNAYRQRIRGLRESLWWLVPLAVILIPAAAAASWFGWKSRWQWILWICACSVTLSAVGAYFDIQSAKKRLVPEDEKRSDGEE